MPGLALPIAVVAVTPGAAIAPTGQSAGSLVSDANAIASGGEATGDGMFATLLGRQMAGNLVSDANAIASGGEASGDDVFAALFGQQMAGATLPAESAPVALSAAADLPQAAPADPAAQAVDLSVLLQGLLLPISARPDGLQAGDPKPDSADALASRPVRVLPGATTPTALPTQAMSDPAAASSTFGEASPGFAQLIADDARQAATDAAVAGKPAETAARELPLQDTRLESQPATLQVLHRLPESVRIERESVVVAAPVISPRWHEDLGSKVTMLIGKEAASAELVLTPPHLGRVEVHLSVSGDQTSATFVAATPAAREALEQALPKLREFLADAGINLTQASVGGDTQAGQGKADGNRGNRSGQGGDSQDLTEIALPATLTRRIDGMVDTFA